MDIRHYAFESDISVVSEPLMMFYFPVTRQAAEGGVQYRRVHGQNEQHLTERLQERLLFRNHGSRQASLSGALKI